MPDMRHVLMGNDTVMRHIGQLVTVAERPISGASGQLQVLSDAALAMHAGKITWIGSDAAMEQLLASQPETIVQDLTVIDTGGAVVTPGLVDAHTHLVFAGDRAGEFHLRHGGKTYGDLLAQGKGILTTVQATRAASSEDLLTLALERLAVMRAHGTTTVEVKTGYGLDLATEERCLHIIAQLNALENREQQHQRIVPTFLGAHSIPAEYREHRTAYVDLVVEQMLPCFAGLARFCDVYCEQGAFTVEESRRILVRAKELGYRIKVHADQLSPSGGSRLAAELGATSADHLDFASDADLAALREAGVIPMLLPGCSYTLRTPYPSARRLFDYGLRVALATDFNPGTCYCENLQMILGLAISLMGMSLEEALTAVTLNAAYALALQDEIGSIEVGKRGEFAIWSVNDYREIGYHFGLNLVRSVYVA
jgi:imidazolonepropionase